MIKGVDYHLAPALRSRGCCLNAQGILGDLELRLIHCLMVTTDSKECAGKSNANGLLQKRLNAFDGRFCIIGTAGIWPYVKRRRDDADACAVVVSSSIRKI